MKKIYFVRHCSAYGQHIDSPLTETGITQAKQLSQFFKQQNISIDKIISSPYLRAIETIKPYAEEHNISISIDQRLKERILSEEPLDDWLDVLEHSFQDPDYKLPGGESASEVSTRANQVVTSVLEDDSITNTIIVSHGNLLAIVFKMFDSNYGFEQWKELRNPDVFLLKHEKNNVSLNRIWDG
ncbi:histidine phosphatase family protein [Oceanobacillus halophilus]|uniref:Histidine phosphatase family protein n=1 Tax=Oceanobacillus halophilus TaxID=930130 RepID=A0A495AHK3_9BACI|nr:histidine phosphatase family protein [Oceanobacillus halophilus]RKQ38005.1 histidine phosphatase family protein [Oceanobacillus halophilus]